MTVNKLTDPRPDWEEKYVNLKISGFYNTPVKRIVNVIDNLIDIYTHPKSVNSVEDIISCIDLIIDTEKLGSEATIIGCGPKPDAVLALVSHGYTEPVDDAVQQARGYLGERWCSERHSRESATGSRFSGIW